MARLSDLKLAMGTSIFIASFIFGLFLLGIIFLLQYYILGFDIFTGLLLGLGGVALFILFQYLVGPAIVAATARLHYLKPGENPWLESTVKELAEKSGVSIPKVATVPNNTPNAFVFGRSASSATLAVHDGLLRNLNQDEIRGVIAHELGHVKHRDFIVMTVLSALPLIAYLIAQFAFRAGVVSSYSRGRNKEGNAGVALIAVGAISFIVYIITFLAVRRLSRLREHYADAYSAYLTGSPRSLESGLAKITYGLSISPKAPEGARAFYIGDPAQAKQEIQQIMENKDDCDLDKDGVLDERELQLAMEKESKSTWVTMNSWFATHPPTFKRILLLREIENEMKSGNYTNDRVYAHV
ncbi:MAG TPA: zinc metalloprotease HtpX [Candidatus Bathyarchaeia archaeon]|nr:zinc metalloprotease HtpX [Candidatus Bathyarchaeia archaeon]